MAKYASIVIGSIVTLLGVFGFLAWWPDMMIIVKGTLPAVMIFAGAIAVIAGLSELKEESGPDKEAQKK
jgi:flagellar motor component MotA